MKTEKIRKGKKENTWLKWFGRGWARWNTIVLSALERLKQVSSRLAYSVYEWVLGYMARASIKNLQAIISIIYSFCSSDILPCDLAAPPAKAALHFLPSYVFWIKGSRKAYCDRGFQFMCDWPSSLAVLPSPRSTTDPRDHQSHFKLSQFRLVCYAA